MKNKKAKTLSMKCAAHTRLHINKDFVTNGHFALRSSLFHVLNLQMPAEPHMQAVDVNGRGGYSDNVTSGLNNEKIERVFEMADACEYENEIPSNRSSDNVTVKLTGKTAVQHIAPKYLPLFERLAAIPGGQWQVNADSPMRALRFVLNGKTEALLMPVKRPE